MFSRGPSTPSVRADEEATRTHVHGFHTYAARMHPGTARRLVESFSKPAGRVLDPFCGSGTVLVEAMVLGRDAVGVDLNPLAVELSRVKTRPTTESERCQLLELAKQVEASAEERRRSRAGPTRRYGSLDRELFDVHVLLELDGLRAGLDALPRGASRCALELVLSSILTKVSKQPGDTSAERVARRIAGGFTLRMFVRRAEELARQQAEFAALLPPSVPSTEVALGDARRLDAVLDRSVDLVVTSPPYPGVYDYLEQHAARLRWLALDATAFAAREIGARRLLEPLGNEGAAKAWCSDHEQCLRAIARVLVPGGTAVLLMADSAIGDVPLFADRITRELAERAGLVAVAAASQPRPHFHDASRAAFGRHRRYEHALLLTRPPEAAMPTRRRRVLGARGSKRS